MQALERLRQHGSKTSIDMPASGLCSLSLSLSLSLSHTHTHTQFVSVCQLLSLSLSLSHSLTLSLTHALHTQHVCMHTHVSSRALTCPHVSSQLRHMYPGKLGEGVYMLHFEDKTHPDSGTLDLELSRESDLEIPRAVRLLGDGGTLRLKDAHSASLVGMALPRRTHARTHVCTHARTHVHTRMHVCTYACTRTHARTHARTRARAHTHTHNNALCRATDALKRERRGVRAARMDAYTRMMHEENAFYSKRTHSIVYAWVPTLV